MNKGTKTKTTVKDVKVLDKNAMAAERMKQVYIHTEDKAEHGMYVEESSPAEYAFDRFPSGVDSMGHETVHQFGRQGHRGVQTIKESTSKVKGNTQKRRATAEQPKKQAEKRTVQQTEQPACRGRRQVTDTVSEPTRAV